MLRLEDGVEKIKGATPAVRRAWGQLGIYTVEDLVMTLPRRYEDFSRCIPLAELRDGEVVTVRVKVVSCTQRPGFRGRVKLIQVRVADETGTMRADFFNQPWLGKEMVAGREIRLAGKVTVDPLYGKSMRSPLWEAADAVQVAAGKLVPVYGLTEALAQKTYRRLMQVCLPELSVDPTSEDTYVEALSLPSLGSAIHFTHAPTHLEEAEHGRRRFAFDEILAYRLALGQLRQAAEQVPAPAMPFDETFAKAFVKHLPFELTGDQKRAVWASMQDMQEPKAMRRLLQGDVGSGKTAVGAFLAAHVHHAGYSSVLLAPTDILARQHIQTFRKFFQGQHIPLLCVTRTEKAFYLDGQQQECSNQELMRSLEKGNVVVIGTHALLYNQRLPKDMALAMVDEQHRFGVGQREALSLFRTNKGEVPHFLSMTATPIPRSLALTLYGDLEVSILREKPAGRLPIKTAVSVGEERSRAYQAVREAVARKEQAFVVCPLIDPSDTLGVRSAIDEQKRLAEGPLCGLRIGLVHGRLKPEEKDHVMNAFRDGQLDVLVATAVIEVGVDIPRATVMLIEGAERFGLAQLHQFRGRVGRSSLASFCYLLTDIQGDSLQRLQLMAQIDDGFQLAEEDLKRRGAGQLMGTEQSGQATFRAARATDLDLMQLAAQHANTLLEKEPNLAKYPRWNRMVEQLKRTEHME